MPTHPDNYESHQMHLHSADASPTQRELELEAEVLELKRDLAELSAQSKADAEWLNKLREENEFFSAHRTQDLTNE